MKTINDWKVYFDALAEQQKSVLAQFANDYQLGEIKVGETSQWLDFVDRPKYFVYLGNPDSSYTAMLDMNGFVLDWNVIRQYWETKPCWCYTGENCELTEAYTQYLLNAGLIKKSETNMSEEDRLNLIQPRDLYKIKGVDFF